MIWLPTCLAVAGNRRPRCWRERGSKTRYRRSATLQGHSRGGAGMQARRPFCSCAAELPFQLQASVDGLRHVRETSPGLGPRPALRSRKSHAARVTSSSLPRSVMPLVSRQPSPSGPTTPRACATPVRAEAMLSIGERQLPAPQRTRMLAGDGIAHRAWPPTGARGAQSA